MSKCEPLVMLDCQWTRTLWATVPVGLLIIGTFGNILTILVLSRRRMRAFTTTVYLICLACGDNTLLWLGMGPRILFQGFDKDVKSESQFVCNITTWLPVTAAGFSIWTIVLMTLERVLLTRWPMSAKAKLTRRNTMIAASVVLGGCVALTSHIPFVAKVDIVTANGTNETGVETIRRCIYAYGKSENFYKRVWPLIVLVVFNVIPILIILLGNITIILTIIAQRRKMRRINPVAHNQQQAVPKKIKSATKRLFLICAMFMVTTLPFTIGHVVLSQIKPNTLEENARKHLNYVVLRTLLYCNFTFNFVLYFVSGSLFKQEWKAMMYELRMKLVKLVLPQEGPDEHTVTQSTRRSDLPSSSWGER